DEGVLDLIFTTAPDETSERVQTLPLVQSPLVVVCATSDALQGRRSVRLPAIAERSQVGFPPGWGVRTQADRAMRAAGVEPRIDLEVNDTTTLLDLVEAGLGIAILPAALAELRPSLHRIAIRGQTSTWAIVAETAAPSPINPAARALWEMLLSDRNSRA
ncbi:MAG TPA: LysR substrate-binding domain-containing protein, partial [Acidimicrobiales bacterium]|nr:LysR substrate-binding domain-containing protein [Acidimicrobiales bacterium]